MTLLDKPTAEVFAPLLTLDEVGGLFGVLPSTVRTWIKKGKLAGLKTPGGTYRVSQRAVRDLMARLEAA